MTRRPALGIAVAAAALAMGCARAVEQRGAPEQRTPSNAAEQRTGDAAEPGTPATIEAHTTPAPLGPSIYELELPLRAASGQTIPLDADRGHPTLVSMFYGSCPAACPALIDEVGRILREANAPDVRVLLVSFDPDRDTPAHLAALARERHLDARWTLASTANATDARTLAAVLGVRFRKLANGEFFHTSVLLVLDDAGRPIARMDGLGAHAGIVAALR
jgi:protein SCO1